MGQLAGPIIRDPSGNAEFIDRKGKLWDVKQFHSEKGRFNLEDAVSNIRRELLAGENVILDTKFLDPNDAAALRSVIEAKGWQSRVLWSQLDGSSGAAQDAQAERLEELPPLDKPPYPDPSNLENPIARSYATEMKKVIKDYLTPDNLKGAWMDIHEYQVPNPNKPGELTQHFREVHSTLYSCRIAIEKFTELLKDPSLSRGDRSIVQFFLSRASKTTDYVEKVIYRDQWFPGTRVPSRP